VHLLFFCTATNKCTIILQFIALLLPVISVDFVAEVFGVSCLVFCTYFFLNQMAAFVFSNFSPVFFFVVVVDFFLLVLYYFNTCTVHLLWFCTMANKCIIISQIRLGVVICEIIMHLLALVQNKKSIIRVQK